MSNEYEILKAENEKLKRQLQNMQQLNIMQFVISDSYLQKYGYDEVMRIVKITEDEKIKQNRDSSSLDCCGMAYERYERPSSYTCEEIKRIVVDYHDYWKKHEERMKDWTGG